MPIEWYLVQNGQQVGPFPEDQLRARAQAGTLRPEEFIWNDTMPQWLPAGQAADWTFGPAPVASPAAPGSAAPPQLAYVSKTDDPLILSPRIFDLMKSTGPWVRFIAVLMYVFAGLLLVLDLHMMLVGRGGIWVEIVVTGCLLNAAISASYLSRYASRIARLNRVRRTIDVEDAVDAQRILWRFWGLLAIAVVGYCIVLLAGAIVLRTLGRL